MHKVRDEKKFSNIESLVRNIEKDVKTVEKWFEKQINDAN